ncbi:MAG: glycosyltransferase [Bdellovibrionales bacterium]|nr:glycosyltransferase [Bdellovibrionales bacterium]
MKISVITITSNSAAFISKNIESVNRQTHTDIEHIFVDNASTDDTLKLIERQSKRSPKIISEPDKGISDAFNKGIGIARGEIIAILNSDDEFFEATSLTRVFEAFQVRPDIDFAHGAIWFEDPEYGSNVRRPLLCPVTEAMPYNHPAFFVKKSFYEELGVFDLDYRYAMDFELISRMYLNPTTPKLKGLEIKGNPLAIMHAGGASWKYESKALQEVERALKKNGLWTSQAARALRFRRYRTQLKHLLTRLNLQGAVRLWRHFKWKSPAS